MDWSKVLAARTALLVVSGLVCFVIAALLIWTPAAWIVGGLGLWLVEFLTNPQHGRERR